jgi:hypothetical protein
MAEQGSSLPPTSLQSPCTSVQSTRTSLLRLYCRCGCGYTPQLRTMLAHLRASFWSQEVYEHIDTLALVDVPVYFTLKLLSGLRIMRGRLQSIKVHMNMPLPYGTLCHWHEHCVWIWMRCDSCIHEHQGSWAPASQHESLLASARPQDAKIQSAFAVFLRWITRTMSLGCSVSFSSSYLFTSTSSVLVFVQLCGRILQLSFQS